MRIPGLKRIIEGLETWSGAPFKVKFYQILTILVRLIFYIVQGHLLTILIINIFVKITKEKKTTQIEIPKGSNDRE